MYLRHVWRRISAEKYQVIFTMFANKKYIVRLWKKSDRPRDWHIVVFFKTVFIRS